MDNSKQLGEGNIGSLLWKFSIPAIIGMVVIALYNIVDRIFVGHGVGLLGISAISIAFPIAIIILAFGLLIGIGAAASISIKLGQKNKAEAEHILGNAFMLSIVISVFLTLIGLAFENPLLRLFGASEEVMPLAREYITIILWGTLFQMIGFTLNSITRAEGNPALSMIMMLLGAILNTILNPLFIFVFGLGIKGSALATLVSQIITGAWMLYYFIKGKSLLKLKLQNLALNPDITKQIVTIGASSFLFEIASSVVIVFFNKGLGTYGGDIAIAAMGIINSIAMLIFMPIIGINQGAQPIIGYNYGARDFRRVKETLKLSLIAATCVSTIGFILVELFPGQILSIFGSDNSSSNKELFDIGIKGMRIYFLMLPIVGFQVISYFQAVGKAAKAVTLSLSKQGLFLLPMLLILPSFFKLNGVWAAGPAADFLSSLLVAIFLLVEMKKINREEKEILLNKEEVI